MPSTKPKVFAYLPQEIYNQVREYKLQHQLPTDSQTLIAILTEFFGSPQQDITTADTALEQRVERLERMFDSLNLMVLGILHTELEETNGSLPGELEETNGSLPSELDELLRRHQLVVCKVSRKDPYRPLYWSGSFKKGFVDQLDLAQTYKESTVKQVFGRVAKSQHAPTDKTEFLSYRALGELEAMAAAIATN